MVALAADAAGKRMVVGSFDHTARIWDLEAGVERRRLKGHDDKVIAVHVDDPEYAVYTDIAGLPPHRLRELERFFLDYKVLEGKEVTVQGFRGVAEAQTVLRDAIALYRRQRHQLQ